MLWAQITLLALVAFSLVSDIAQHGDLKPASTRDFYHEFFVLVVSFTLMWCAGAFNKIF